jgi:hypothetical protein
MRKAILITGGVIGFLCFIICVGVFSPDTAGDPTPTKTATKTATQAPTKTPTQSVSVTPTVTPAPTKPPISPKKKKENILKATVLAEDYAANELAADKKYKGKQFTIVGVVESISKVFGSTSVTLTGDGFLYSINCAIDKEQESKVAELVKGEEVSISGTIKGYGISIDVKDCKIK